MSKDKLTGHPSDVVVVPDLSTVRAKPTVVRKGEARDPHGDSSSDSITVLAAAPSRAHGTGDNPKETFRGQPARGENDLLHVCSILRDALNDSGDTWGAFSAQPATLTGAVATATDERGDVLSVHVTRVDRPAPRAMDRGDPVARRRSVGQRVADIRVAVDSSARQHTATQRGELCLALDTLRSSGHVNGKVVEAFLTAHQTYAAGLGYRAIWLVGPTGEMTHQLC